MLNNVVPKGSLCRVNDGLNKLFTQIENCTTEDEGKINDEFGKTVLGMQADIKDLKANITNSLTNVDQYFATRSHDKVIDEVKQRNKELKAKHESLSHDILEKEAIINRSDQDFKDVKATIPEPQPKKILRFVEDYTLAVFIISYLFLMISGICFYTLQSDSTLRGLIESSLGSVILTVVIFMLFFR